MIGAIEIGILGFCLRCEDVLQLPFAKYIYGDLTPIADGTRFGKAFILMTLVLAFVAAIVYLAWLLERPVLLVPALDRLGRAALGALALGPRRRRRRLVEGDRARRLGALLGGLALARRARRAGGGRVAGRARAAPERVRPLLAGSRRADRARARRGDVPRARAGPAPARPLDAALRRGAAREDLARLRLPSRGARSTTSSCVRGSPRRGRGRSRGSGAASAARRWSAIAVLLAGGDPGRLEAAAAAGLADRSPRRWQQR